jgi:aminoglycoside 3-N-acetyltransferase
VRPPATVDSLVDDLRRLGLPEGRSVLVHCSMRRIGPVAGGAAGLLRALQAVIGPDACVVVPAHTADNSTTSPSFAAATAGRSPAEVARYTATMPGFDPASTPSFGMGAFAEHVRRSDAIRSAHPQTSFAAVGGDARTLLADHPWDCHLGPGSPLDRLYQQDATVLLLGVGYDVCTAFHLAEYRPEAPRRWYHCFVGTGSQRRQYDFVDVDLDDSDFDVLGKDLETTTKCVVNGPVGAAAAKRLAIRDAVDFAAGWLAAHR